MTLSIIVTGSNDNHNSDFIARLNYSVMYNCVLLDNFLDKSVDYNYTIVSWGSPEGNEIFRQKNILTHQKIIFISVSKEIIKTKFSTDMFYQFFAKNVGIIHSSGEYILMINADNLLTVSLIKEINIVFKLNETDRFYRTKYWCDIELPTHKLLKKVNCINGRPEEIFLAPVYSGDFILCRKDTLIIKGKGFDESNIKHQQDKKQAHMDGEILINLYKNGVMPVITESCIKHIHHTKGSNFDYEYNMNGYSNTNNWGFQDKKLKQFDKNIFILI